MGLTVRPISHRRAARNQFASRCHGHAEQQCGNKRSLLCARPQRSGRLLPWSSFWLHLMSGLSVRGEKRASRAGGPGASHSKGLSDILWEKKWRVAPPASHDSGAWHAASVTSETQCDPVRALWDHDLPAGRFKLGWGGRHQKSAVTAADGFSHLRDCDLHSK